jgi:hypothetical protein
MHRGTAMAFWDSAVFVRIVGHPDVERRSPAITRQGVTDGAPPVLSESVAPTPSVAGNLVNEDGRPDTVLIEKDEEIRSQSSP